MMSVVYRKRCLCMFFNNIPSASGGFALRPPPGLRPWTPLADFRPLAKIPAGAHGGPHILF